MKKTNKKKIEVPEDVKEGVEKSVKGVGKLLREFKEFAMRGNMVDMAVGIVLGSAFTEMINSIVKGILNPLVKHFTGQGTVGELTINGFAIGSVLDSVINFIIVAAVIFAVVKVMNTLSNINSKDKDEGEKALVTEVEILEEIRDLMKDQRKIEGLSK